jgi:hypothetical protein
MIAEYHGRKNEEKGGEAFHFLKCLTIVKDEFYMKTHPLDILKIFY